jgi:hypothetical protein
VIVQDIEKENAFDEAVMGVDGVLHTASPFHVSFSFYINEFIQPSLNAYRNLALILFSLQLTILMSLLAPRFRERLEFSSRSPGMGGFWFFIVSFPPN